MSCPVVASGSFAKPCFHRRARMEICVECFRLRDPVKLYYQELQLRGLMEHAAADWKKSWSARCGACRQIEAPSLAWPLVCGSGSRRAHARAGLRMRSACRSSRRRLETRVAVAGAALPRGVESLCRQKVERIEFVIRQTLCSIHSFRRVFSSNH